MHLERLLSATLLGVVCGCSAQLSAIPTRSDSLTTPTSWECSAESQPFEQLWSTMDSVLLQQIGDLSILHIGGSHVQAGWIGHEMRRLLAQWAPKAKISRGMHLPYRLAHTNTPTHFRTDMEGSWAADRCTRGNGKLPCATAPIATGILAYPSDAASIQHVSYLPDSSHISYTTLEIWTNAKRSQWQWTGNAPLRSCSPLPENHGWILNFDAPADTLALSFVVPKTSRSVWYAGMHGSQDSTNARIVWHEWGHNGLRIRHAAAQDGWENLLQRIEPDLIFVGVGLNDAVDGEHLNMAAFASHYETLAGVLVSSGAAVVLLGNTPAMHRNTSLEASSDSIGNWLHQHSKANGMAYLDLTSAIGGPGIVPTWMENGRMQSDGMHFTSEGYGVIAGALHSAWMDAYVKSQKAPSLDNTAAPRLPR